MNFKKRIPFLLFGLPLLLLTVFTCQAQTSEPSLPAQETSQTPSTETGHHHGGRRGQMDGHGTVGQITAIQGDNFTVARPDGTKVTVMLTGKTGFRKDRQPAKRADFKVGDFVMVRGEENADIPSPRSILGGVAPAVGPEE